jgi:hypothetical protein
MSNIREKERKRKSMPIHIYPTYERERAKKSRPSLSETLMIKGARVINIKKNIRPAPANVPTGKAFLILRNANKCIPP